MQDNIDKKLGHIYHTYRLGIGLAHAAHRWAVCTGGPHGNNMYYALNAIFNMMMHYIIPAAIASVQSCYA